MRLWLLTVTLLPTILLAESRVKSTNISGLGTTVGIAPGWRGKPRGDEPIPAFPSSSAHDRGPAHKRTWRVCVQRLASSSLTPRPRRSARRSFSLGYAWLSSGVAQGAVSVRGFPSGVFSSAVSGPFRFRADQVQFLGRTFPPGEFRPGKKQRNKKSPQA